MQQHGPSWNQPVSASTALLPSEEQPAAGTCWYCLNLSTDRCGCCLLRVGCLGASAGTDLSQLATEELLLDKLCPL